MHVLVYGCCTGMSAPCLATLMPFPHILEGEQVLSSNYGVEGPKKIMMQGNMERKKIPWMGRDFTSLEAKQRAWPLHISGLFRECWLIDGNISQDALHVKNIVFIRLRTLIRVDCSCEQSDRFKGIIRLFIGRFGSLSSFWFVTSWTDWQMSSVNKAVFTKVIKAWHVVLKSEGEAPI